MFARIVPALLATAFAAPLAAQSPSYELDVTVLEARGSIAGSWTGELQYRDYQSDRWIGIPMSVDIELIEDGVTLIRKAVFDDGPMTGWVYITSVNMLGPDGTTEYVSMFRADRGAELGEVRLRLEDARDWTNWTIVAEQEGMDDNRPALIRETTTRAGDSLITLKEVDFLDDESEEWLARNRTVLTLEEAE